MTLEHLLFRFLYLYISAFNFLKKINIIAMSRFGPDLPLAVLVHGLLRSTTASGHEPTLVPAYVQDYITKEHGFTRKYLHFLVRFLLLFD